MDRLRKPKQQFTQIPNELICSSELSSKAKAVYCYLMSRPDDWKFYTSEIVKNMRESKNTVVLAINELIAAFWIEKTQIRAKGRFSHNEYSLFYEVSTVNQKTVHGKTVTQKTVHGILTPTNTDYTNTNNTNSNAVESFQEFKKRYIKDNLDKEFFTTGIGLLVTTGVKVDSSTKLLKNMHNQKTFNKEDAYKIWIFLYSKQYPLKDFLNG